MEPDYREYKNPVSATPLQEKQMNSIKETRIRQLNHGYVIDVGCHSFAIESAQKAIELLGKYIINPSATEKEWFEGSLLK